MEKEVEISLSYSMGIDRLKFEKRLWEEGYKRVMGLDEVGRGCLAGPVIAAGVILPPGFSNTDIRDSKKLNEKDREELACVIKKEALFYQIEEGSLREIEKLNILWASLTTMEKCALSRDADPDYLMVDGNRYVPSLIPHTCIVKGDDLSVSIAAASILAKTYRDELMKRLAEDYPEFDWRKNVGYPTKKHKEALLKYGYTEHHRKSFNLGTKKQYKKQQA